MQEEYLRIEQRLKRKGIVSFESRQFIERERLTSQYDRQENEEDSEGDRRQGTLYDTGDS